MAEVIVGVAECALANPQIAELEVNPLFAHPDRAIAVDVRAARIEAGVAQSVRT